jgi:Flp pilus assembly protein TadD
VWSALSAPGCSSRSRTGAVILAFEMRWPVVSLSCLAAMAQQVDSAVAKDAALALLRQGKIAEAVPYLERARAAEPSNYEASWNLALAYSRLNRLAAARELLRAMPRDRGETRNLLASVEERSGRVREAAIEYQEAAHLEPSEKHIADWANHLLKHRAFDSALKVYASGANMHPKSIPLRVGLGAAHYSAGNYDDAARELCAAADLDPADLRSFSHL